MDLLIVPSEKELNDYLLEYCESFEKYDKANRVIYRPRGYRTKVVFANDVNLARKLKGLKFQNITIIELLNTGQVLDLIKGL